MTSSLALAPWFESLVEQIDAVAVETIYNAQQTILEGKLEIGELIARHASKGGVNALVHQLGARTRLSRRELFYCYQFHVKQPKLKEIPEYSEKTISWNKVKKLMAGPDRKEACLHKHKVRITLCEDCGKRVWN